MTYTLAERCSCGSRFTLSAPYADRLAVLVEKWRADHRHEAPARMPDVHFPPVPQGTASTVEHAGQPDYDNRQPIGFAGSTA